MHANLIMTKDVVSCQADQTVAEVIEMLRDRSVRMIPVVDAENRVLGAVNTLTLLAHLVPEYIVKGDLKSIPYAPDMGLLRKHYKAILGRKVSEVMNNDPTIVRPDESLLSVAAALLTYDRFEYALVAGADRKLVGVVASSDILATLSKLKPEEIFDA